ncbi:MAG TPA: ABC-F family ATP-binding cassette domain-containing protein [Saprospiraceae bacterium]|nr:ABC-F family ATP-binding cassette domain-containing protein [Saprospiraceae bacterium]
MIRFQDVSLFFGERSLFDKVSFTISPGEKVAICGRNGSGKSTLFKLLLKDLKPDNGIIEIQGQPTIGTLKQELPPDKGYSIFEEVRRSQTEAQELKDRLASLEHKLTSGDISDSEAMELVHQMEDSRHRLEFLEVDKLDGRIERILQGLGFTSQDFEKRLSTFSGGWRMRVELAKLLISRPDILLLDEPNNHLDIVSLRWLELFLKAYEGTVLLISHDLVFLDQVANRIIEIDRGKLYDFKGNYSAFKKYREERRSIELNEFNAQQRQIQHKEMLIEKFRYKASKASFAQSLITELNRLDRKELPEEEQSTIKLRFKACRPGGIKVLELKDLKKQYDTKTVLKDVNLFVERGSKISFIGANGKGKSTLVRIMSGQLSPTEGVVDMGHQTQLGYYAQEHGEVLVSDISALNAVEDVALPDLRTQVRAVLGGLGFSGDDAEKRISVLSGGEKARIRLAQLLVTEHNMLILDEPTHHLDMPSKERLKDALMHYEGTVIIVSHDRDFLKGLADKTILFEDQGIRVYEGDIDYYLEKTESSTIYDLPDSSKKRTAEQNTSNGPADRKKLQRLVQNLEKEILKLESQIKEHESRLSDPQFYMNAAYNDTLKKYEAAKTKLEQCNQEWEEVVSRL